MKWKTFVPAILLATAAMAFAGNASATTLEVKGVKQTGAVTIKATLKSGSSGLLSATGGAFANTCTASTVEGKTSTFTGATVSGPISTLSVGSCTLEASAIDSGGSFTLERIGTTTNATVRSIGAKVTSPSPFGAITCTTAASPGTDIGTLTGVASGNATLDINAVLNCGFFLPSAKLEATYTVTSPEGLGVTE